MMHPIKVWDVSLYKRKKVVAYSLSQVGKRGLDYPTYYDLELSIMEHGSNIFLDIKVTFRWIIRIY